jgi:hypothetical protein
MEVSRIEADFSISIFNLVMVSKETSTYASPFGMGFKYYTSFTDGTCLITVNFDTPAINDQVGKLYKFTLPRNITTAHQDHKKLADELCSQGKQKIEHLSFAGFIQLAHKEDEYLLKHKNQFG